MLGTIHYKTGRTMQPIKEWEKGKNLPYGRQLKMAKDKNGERIVYADSTELFYVRYFVQVHGMKIMKAGKKTR